MRLNLIIPSLMASAILFSGCGGGNNNNPPPPPIDTATTLFLIDQDGFSLGGVPYICDTMADWALTRPNGEFTFLQPEGCRFDFTGYVGNYNNDYVNDDIIYIVDDLDRGKGNIPYECDYFGASSTYGDGSFDYDADDACTFYL